MNEERRSAIKQLVMIAGGMVILPSCIRDPKQASIPLKNLAINQDQEKLLADIAATLIPQTDTPGAKELGVHLFVLKMLDDCYEKEVQQTFVKGLAYLDESSRQRFDRLFVNCTATQRQQLLHTIERESGYPAELIEFYTIMKQRTIQGYLTSKYVMTNVLEYALIPRTPYNGYYPVEDLKLLDNA